MALNIKRILTSAAIAARGIRTIDDLPPDERDVAILEAGEAMEAGLSELSSQYADAKLNDAASELEYLADQVRQYRETVNGHEVP